jgi:hypothetical protein
MLQEGSLVKLVGMEYDYTSPYSNHKIYNGSVGTVIHYNKVTNINYGYVTEICMVDLIVPVLSLQGNPIRWVVCDGRNLVEIERVPIKQGGQED